MRGERVALRPVSEDDVAALAAIRATPEVRARWGRGDDYAAEERERIADPGVSAYVIEADGRVVGMIQSYEHDDPQYRHAGIDLYVDPAVHRQGIGSDAIRTVVRHLFAAGHHRVVIDPVAGNAPAIACYSKVGFRAVGVMRQYQRRDDGTWEDGLLMELLSQEFEG